MNDEKGVYNKISVTLDLLLIQIYNKNIDSLAGNIAQLDEFSHSKHEAWV